MQPLTLDPKEQEILVWALKPTISDLGHKIADTKQLPATATVEAVVGSNLFVESFTRSSSAPPLPTDFSMGAGTPSVHSRGPNFL